MDPIVHKAFIIVREQEPPQHYSNEDAIRGFIEVIDDPHYIDSDFALEVIIHMINHMNLPKNVIADIEHFGGGLFGGRERELHFAEVEALENQKIYRREK